MTKMGCRRTEPRKRIAFITKVRPPERKRQETPRARVSFMARTPLKRVSKKQSKENAELRTLVSTLRESAKSGSLYISELTSKLALRLDPHHFGGRGKNLCNPFTIIM